MAHELHAIAATTLVPVSELEQCRVFRSREAALGKSLQIRHDWLSLCCHVTLFIRLDGCIHNPILSTHQKECSCCFHCTV